MSTMDVSSMAEFKSPQLAPVSRNKRPHYKSGYAGDDSGIDSEYESASGIQNGHYLFKIKLVASPLASSG